MRAQGAEEKHSLPPFACTSGLSLSRAFFAPTVALALSLFFLKERNGKSIRKPSRSSLLVIASPKRRRERRARHGSFSFGGRGGERGDGTMERWREKVSFFFRTTGVAASLARSGQLWLRCPASIMHSKKLHQNHSPRARARPCRQWAHLDR